MQIYQVEVLEEDPHEQETVLCLLLHLPQAQVREQPQHLIYSIQDHK